jgi:hypothetical protein
LEEACLSSITGEATDAATTAFEGPAEAAETRELRASIASRASIQEVFEFFFSSSSFVALPSFEKKKTRQRLFSSFSLNPKNAKG